MFCKQCGAKIDDESLFCQACGCKCEFLNANIQEQSNAPSIPKKDRLTNISLILSVFSIFLPLGIILPLPGIPVPEGLVILFCVFGFLAFLLAFIISSIAFIRVLIKLIK